MCLRCRCGGKGHLCSAHAQGDNRSSEQIREPVPAQDIAQVDADRTCIQDKGCGELTDTQRIGGQRDLAQADIMQAHARQQHWQHPMAPVMPGANKHHDDEERQQEDASKAHGRSGA